MNCDNEYRHVCFKDLENYFKKDAYFSDLSDDEKALIRKNLGISEQEGQEGTGSLVIVGTHNYIKNLLDLSLLQIGSIYVINNFRSIYSMGNEVLGLDKVPSNEYYILLRPIGSNQFDLRVSLMTKSASAKSTGTQWLVEYSIYPRQLIDGSYDLGLITYLKDLNNNSAYYDFKNIRFKRTIEELNKGFNTYEQDQYLYTFDQGGSDNSETINCKNNLLQKGAYNNVFLGTTQNNTLAADVHNNTFFKSCENNTFDYGMRNNYILNDIRLCRGAVHDKELSEIISMLCPKEFNILEDSLVLVYLDSLTLTYQIKKL